MARIELIIERFNSTDADSYEIVVAAENAVFGEKLRLTNEDGSGVGFWLHRAQHTTKYFCQRHKYSSCPNVSPYRFVALDLDERKREPRLSF